MKYTEKEIVLLGELKKWLPGIKIDSMRAGSASKVRQSVLFESARNEDWIDSKYYYKSKLALIHFTSVAALESIIRERAIRLYNLYNLNDPREYSYAESLLPVGNEIKEDAKENTYLLSLCESSILKGNTQFEFNLWRLYGSEGQGVAIEFEFDEHTPLYWWDYFLSKVHYGDPHRKPLKKLKELLQKYQNDPPSVDLNLSRIACFHKSMLFGLEKEVRLLFDGRKKKGVGTTIYSNAENNQTSPIIRTDIQKTILKGKQIQYLELPIFHKDFNLISKHIPIPKIKRVILGFKYKNNFVQVGKSIIEHSINHLGFPIKIEESRLTQYYHD